MLTLRAMYGSVAHFRTADLQRLNVKLTFVTASFLLDWTVTGQGQRRVRGRRRMLLVRRM
jgi:hypothetical protein